jgi:2-desacetyl-2-hydroxyethyl bacteriochlorophyllide A dehydrogenase
MGYAILLTAPKQIELREYAEPPLGAHQVRIETVYSGISAGTELASYRGTSPFLHKRWDAEQRLFVEGDGAPAYPVTNLGYAEVGQVVEIGSAVTRVNIGERVWGTWGHKSAHVAEEEWAAARVLDASLDVRAGIFSHVGAIALNVVLDADIHVGEYVAVFGQGVMGLAVMQLARLNGGTVMAVDAIPQRLALAQELGAEYIIHAREQDAAQVVKTLTQNRGADVSIEITGAYSALQTALRATAYNSRVVVAGFFQGDARGLFLGEEFHHNRLQIIASQISGSAPRLAHRWDRLRLNQTVMQLQAQRKINLTRLISHTFPARAAADAFRLLDEGGGEVLQVVLAFAQAQAG